MARPPVVTPAQVEAVELAVADGLCWYAALDAAGISRRTGARWAARGEKRLAAAPENRSSAARLALAARKAGAR